VSNFKWGLISAICALLVSILLGIVSEVGVIHIIIRALIFSAVFFGLGFGLRFILDSFFPELLTFNEETVLSEDESDGHVSIAMDSMGEYAVPELFNKRGNSQEMGNIEDLISGVFRPHSEDDDFDSSGNQSEYPKLDFSMSDSKGIDQNDESGYNSLGEIGNIPFEKSGSEKPAVRPVTSFEKSTDDKRPAEKPAAFQPSFTPSFGNDDSGLGGLPDLDMMAMAFSSNYSDIPAAASASASHSAFSAPAAHPVEEFEPDRSQYKGNKPQTLQGDFNPQSLAEGIRTVLSKD
jgi:hypothetical protein